MPQGPIGTLMNALYNMVAKPLQCDVNGNLNVNIANGGGSYPSGATPITADSGNVADAIATATLAAAAAKTTYLTGFVVSASGATAGLPVTGTITGVVGGPLHFTFVFPAGVLVGAVPLVVNFEKPIPASAVDTAIAIALPAGGAGNTNATVNATGYQL